MAKGTLYIISAPSGAGKTSLVKTMLGIMTDVVVSISHTTRARRSEETEGKEYHFVDDEVFDQMVERGEFLEHARVFGNKYGTSRQHLQEQLLLGRDVILEVDWQGARQIRQLINDCKTIFVLPPTMQSLCDRLIGRGQDTEATIELRMKEAISEMSHYAEFDYIVINDDFDTAVAEMSSIFVSNRLLTDVQQQRHAKILAELLVSKT